MHSPEVLHKEPETKTPENTPPNIVDIPKSREIFTGDINDAVIKVQQMTGFEITPNWWAENVGNEGPTEDILDRFDTAFEQFVREEMGVDTPEVTEEDIVAEADTELANFDKKFADDPGAAPLRDEFIDALGEHLKEKYIPEEMDEKTRFEYDKFEEIFDKYPAAEHEVAFTQNGIEVVACGRSLETHETEAVRAALDTIESVIGAEAMERLFGGTRLYAGEQLIKGGGLALPRFDAIVIDLEKIGITVAQMEREQSKIGAYAEGDQSRLVDDPETADASVLGIVHELGHILEFRKHEDVDVAFAALNQADAPTMYGGMSAREDYAESFLYYIYGGDITNERRRIIESDIS